MPAQMPSCPTCKRPVEWSPAFPWRPFCSERCKLIDLGAWASERHAIPTDANIDEQSESSEGSGLAENDDWQKDFEQ
jgi:endogenous inhibitor of DNA gyrase (YacG/DUF329 family)